MRSFVLCATLCFSMLTMVASQVTIGPLNSIRITTGVPIDPSKSPCNRPICVAHAWAEDKLLLSQDYPTGVPYSFYVIEQDGGLTPWGSENGLTGEIMLDVVPAGNLGGYIPGDLFTGNGKDGMVMRVTNKGQTSYRSWCNLKEKTAISTNIGLLRGALHFDRYGAFDYDLVVATASGYVFRVAYGERECASVTFLGNTGVHLEGMTVLPTETAVPGSNARWGRFAGAALIGAEQQGSLWVFWANGTSERIGAVGCNVEDLDEVPADEKGSYYIVNYGSNAIFAVDFSQFSGHAHKIIATQESGQFFEVMYEKSTNTLHAYQITMNGYSGSGLEQATFSLSGVNEILPADFSLCIDDSSSSSSASLMPIMLGHYDHGLTQMSNYLLTAGSARSSMVGRALNDELRVMLTQDYRNQFTITIMTGTMTSAVGFTVSLTTSNGATSFPLGSGIRALVQDDSADSIVVVPSAGSVAATFATAAGETDGFVLGPIDFVTMKTLIEIEISVTVISGSFAAGMVVATYSGGVTTPPSAGTIVTNPFTSPLMLKRIHCNCGNGVIDRAEQCDSGQTANPCCDGCQFAWPATPCRDQATICDVPEFCPGDSAACPADKLVPASAKTQCSLDPVTQNCSYCSGVTNTCPSVASAPAACPTCTQLNNCTNHGVCDQTNSPPVCICNNQTATPYIGPTCAKPDCSSLKSCGACSAHPECGWCCSDGSGLASAAGVCVKGNAQGPKASSGFNNRTCPDYQYDSCVCPNGCNNGTCNCGTCICTPPMGGPTCDRTIDCNGILGGGAVYGVCGCDKGDTVCLGCDGIPFGNTIDVCEICGGDGSTCYNPCESDSCGNCLDLEDCVYCITNEGVEQCVPEAQEGACDRTAETEAECEALNQIIDEEVAAGIAGGILAGIIIGAIIACITLAGGGYGGYKALERYKGQVSNATTNPLFEEKEMAGVNPLAEDEPSLLIGVNA